MSRWARAPTPRSVIVAMPIERLGENFMKCCRGYIGPAPVAAIGYRVGTVPPSIRCSDPDIEAEREDARNTIKFATSCGVGGGLRGIPPSQSMMFFLPPS